MQLRIMSFNTQHCLNYLTRQGDFERMAEAILECKADIVGLNEMYNLGSPTHPELLKQTEKLAQLTGLSYHYFACALDFYQGIPIQYGNGILSRYPILSAETIPVDEPADRSLCPHYEPRCVLKATIDAGSKITVMTTHFGLAPAEQDCAVNTVMRAMEREKCILMGDFNVLPDNPVLAPIRDQMKDCADLFEAEKLSFPSDQPDRKIDYLFLSQDITPLAADIPAIIASDHRPHTALIDI